MSHGWVRGGATPREARRPGGVLRKIVGQAVGVAILLGFLFGVLVLVFMPFELYRMAQARSWPSREGVVTRSFASPQGAAWKTTWRAAIRGIYRDTSEEFWVTRVRYGDFRMRGDRSGAEADAAKYRPGTVVRVYFSPDNAKETLLEPSPPWTTVIVITAIGAVGLLLPAVLFVFRKS